MATFGNTTGETAQYKYAAEGKVIHCKFTLAEVAEVISMHAYCCMSGTSRSQVARMMIYDDDGANGAPGTLKGITGEINVNSTTLAWYQGDFPSAVSLAAGDWYLSLWWGDYTTAGYLRLYEAATGGEQHLTESQVVLPYASTGNPPSPEDITIDWTDTCKSAIYATYTVPASGLSIPLLNHLLLGD